MRLICGRPSGFSRKARVVVHEVGLTGRVEVEFLSPQADAATLAALTPLGKVPVLVVGDEVLLDSPVICAYLCEAAGNRTVLPTAGPDRWRTLAREAIADGILEAGMLARAEAARSEKEGSRTALDWQLGKVRRGLAQMEQAMRVQFASAVPDLGDIALACAIGWLDFRLPHLNLLEQHPRLRERQEQWLLRPSFTATVPAT